MCKKTSVQDNIRMMWTNTLFMQLNCLLMWSDALNWTFLNILPRSPVEFVLSRQPEAGAAEECSAGVNGACNPALHNRYCPDWERRGGLLSHYRMSQVNKKCTWALDVSLQLWMSGTLQWALFNDFEMLPREIFCCLLNMHEKRFVELSDLSKTWVRVLLFQFWKASKVLSAAKSWLQFLQPQTWNNRGVILNANNSRMQEKAF